jgi:hypothetical protein
MTMHDRRNLYFAYGSNLDLEQMRERCPWSEPLCAARLRRHRLAFAGHSALWDGGVATLVADPFGHVDGVLYALTDNDIAALDRWEGHPNVYRRERVSVRAGSRGLSAYTYIRSANPPANPSAEYLSRIERAYRRHQFDVAALREALQGAA